MSCIPLAFSFHFLWKEYKCSYHQGSSAKTEPAVYLFTLTFQQKCKRIFYISHFYTSFRLKIPLKIKTLQAMVFFSFANCCESYPYMIWGKIGSFVTSRVCELFKNGLKQQKSFLQVAQLSWKTSTGHALPVFPNKPNENIPCNTTHADLSSSAHNGKNRSWQIN